MPVRVRLRARVKRPQRLVGWALAFLGVLLGLGLVSLKAFLSTERGQRWIRFWLLEGLQSALGTEASLRAIHMQGLSALTVEGFTLYDKQCEPFIEVKRLVVGWLPGLFWQGFWQGQKRIPLSYLKLERPRVYLYTERQSGLTNVDRLFASSSTDTTRTEWRFRLPRLSLTNGTFIWRDSTVPDSELFPKAGYMNYANLQLEDINLEATVDIGAYLVFVYVLRLKAHERAAGVQLDSLSLVLRAYPDSTVVDTLVLRSGETHLRGGAKFHCEGLAKLFLDTDTKQFTARLRGDLGWADVARYSGAPLPLVGTWAIALQAEGDLRRIRWPYLRIELGSTHYLVTRGQIWHYARPQLMHWDVRIDTAQLTLGEVSRAFPALVSWPEGFALDSLWTFSGRVVGALSSYWVACTTSGLGAEYAMEKVGGVWHWQAKAQLEGLSVARLWPAWPLYNLSGQLKGVGKGFGWPSLEADLRAELQGRWDTLPFSRVVLDWHQERDTATFQLGCQGLPVDFSLGARLGLGPPYFGQLEARLRRLEASLWGEKGHLSASGLVASWRGVSLQELVGKVAIGDLTWALPDTLIYLGDIQLTLSRSSGSVLTLQAEGLSLDLVTTAERGKLFQAIRALAGAFEGWIEEAQAPILSDSLCPDSVGLRLAITNWGWLHLGGVPKVWQGGEALFRADWTQANWRLQLSVDSIVFPQGDLHDVKLTARGQWFPMDLLQIDFSVAYGERYFLFRDLSFHHGGSFRAGEVGLYCKLGFSDSVALVGSWSWPGDTFPLVVVLAPQASGLLLAGQSWHFATLSTLHYQAGRWLFGFRAQSQTGMIEAEGAPEELRFTAQGLPLGPLLKAFGYAVPLDGVASVRYVQESKTALALRIDSVRYEGLSLPTFWLETDWVPDTLKLNLGLVAGLDTFLNGRGVYVLEDSVAPLALSLSTKKRLPVQWLSPFFGSYVQNLQGAISIPRLAVRGKLDSPKLKGQVLLDQVSFYVPYLRLSYRIDNVVEWEGDTLRFREVVVQDPHQKALILSGYIALQGWRAPYLNLGIRVHRAPFLLLATRSATDAYLYGQVLIDYSDLKLVGPWYRPTIRGTLRLAEGTEITLPVETYLRSHQRSYVRYVGEEAFSEPVVAAPTGVDIQVNFRSVPGVRFRLLFDSRTGDEIVAQGNASIYLEITADGQLSIAGSYEVSAGEYRFNLQGFAAKKLSLEPGSRITWDGDLFAGKLQMTAVYRTYTSLRLIDTSYTATMPVEVRVFLQGTLLAPQMSFQIDIPSLAGNPSPLIVLFTQRLQNDENERNRQVFALLTLGSFLPSDQATAAAGSTANPASTLSEFLSAQLSSLIGQVVGGQLGLSFGMGQWQDLSARLQLSLGNRLTIQREGTVLAPGQTAPALGNLSVRYRLLPRKPTSPTQLQLEGEAFNRQTFLGGQLGTTSQGIGLRLRKSFYLPWRRREEPTLP